MPTILITGSTGFVGKHLVTALPKRYTLLTTIPEKSVDYIINLASISSVEQSIKEPAPVIRNNVDCMVEILEYARKYPPKLLLHMSTVEAVEPRNPYAASKAAQEALAIAYQATYGLPISIAMSHNIIGRGQGPDKFIPKIIELVKKGQAVNIYTEKGVVGSRTYNPVANVVSGLLHILALPPSYYNIDSGGLYNNLDIAKKVAAKLGKPLKHKLIEGRTVRPGYSLKLVSDGVPLTSTGWQAPQSLNQGLEWIH